MEENKSQEDNDKIQSKDVQNTPKNSEDKKSASFTEEYSKSLTDNKPEYIETKFGIADADLKKMGFLTAVENAENPFEKYNSVIKEHQTQINEIRDRSEIIAEEEKRRYEILIEEARIKTEEYKKELNAYLEEIGDKEKNKIELKNDLQRVKDKIYFTYNELAELKRNFLSNRIDEVQKDLKNLIDGQANIFRDGDGFFKGYIAAGNQITNNSLERIKNIIAAFEKRFDEVQLFIQCIDKHAVSAVSYNFLIYFGYLAALIAGYFFTSIISEPAKDGSPPPNILNDLIQATLLFVHSHDRWQGLLLLIGFLVGLTIISFILDYFMRWYKAKLIDKNWEKLLFKSNGDSDTDNEFNFALDEFESLGVKISFKSDSWLYFWLQIVPILLLLAAGIFILSYKYYGYNEMPVYQFGSAIAGTVIALALGGFTYLLISKRFQTKCNPNSNIAKSGNNEWLEKDWELKLLLGILVIWNVILLILYFLHSFSIIQSQNIWDRFVPMGEYIVVTLVCAICMGYGLYLRSVTEMAENLEQHLDILHSKQRFYYQLAPSLYYTNSFGKTFRDLHLQLITLLGKRISPRFSYRDKEEYSEKRDRDFVDNFNFLNRLIWWSKSNSKETTTDQTPHISINWGLMEEDRLLFPDIHTKLTALDKERSDIEGRLIMLDVEINSFKNKKSDRYINLERRVDLVTEYINGWRTAIIEVQKKYLTELKHLRRQNIKERVILMDGFHLGMWHRENDMGPISGFYEQTGNNIGKNSVNDSTPEA